VSGVNARRRRNNKTREGAASSARVQRGKRVGFETLKRSLRKGVSLQLRRLPREALYRGAFVEGVGPAAGGAAVREKEGVAGAGRHASDLPGETPHSGCVSRPEEVELPRGTAGESPEGVGAALSLEFEAIF
jgi:hypothetical protein